MRTRCSGEDVPRSHTCTSETSVEAAAEEDVAVVEALTTEVVSTVGAVATVEQAS